MNKTIRKCFLGGLLFCLSTAGYAVSLQIFSPLAFQNPAALQRVKKFQLTLAATQIYQNLNNTGVSGGMRGTAKSSQTLTLPAFAWDLRVNPKLVVGLHVTEPFTMDDEYSPNSFIRYIAVKTEIKSTDVSPNAAIQITKNVSAGFGLDFLNLSAQFDSVIPPNSLVPIEQPFMVKASGWGRGWHAGLIYHVLKATFLGLNYYSKIDEKLTGNSSYGNLSTSSNVFVTTTMPATTTLTLTQFLKRTWFVRATVRYTQWNVLQTLSLRNTALGNLPPIVLGFHNRFSYGLSTDYGLNKQWSLLGLVSYSPTPGNQSAESPRSPDGNTLGIGTGFIYKISKQADVALFYEHSFVQNVTINGRSNLGILSTGVAKMADNTVSVVLRIHGL